MDLNLEGTSLTSIKGLTHLKFLRHLNVANNQLTVIPSWMFHKTDFSVFSLETLDLSQWRSQYRGKGGRVPPLTAKNLPKIRKNREKRGKSGKIRKNSGKKKRKNREEKAKIGKILSLCPSWQKGLATLLIWAVTLFNVPVILRN